MPKRRTPKEEPVLMIESGVADVVFIDRESQEHTVYQLVAGDCIGLSGLLSFSVSSTTKTNFL